MTSDILRAELINTDVITRSTGKRLGVVKEVLVDIDRREVVALGLRDNRFSLSGLPRYMYLNSIVQSSDVILVEDENVIEDVEVELYSQLINSEVITETGEPLGKVRDFQFNLEDGKVSSLIISSLGLPQIPDQIISTYEIKVEEIVSSGPNRIIVFEGAETRLQQLTVGILERLGIGKPPWEREEEEMYYAPTTPPENQLPTGIPVQTPVASPVKRVPVAENWSDDDWESTPPPRRQAESIRYAEDEDEEDNWGEGRNPAPRYEAPPVYEPASRSRDYDYEDDDVEGDVWDDDVEGEPYHPPRVNIPQKQKAPEYYEED
ncbi:MAG: PRC-barrel domain-containing protein [Gomphosphaeria aponina SAG 52.96 = DSM 107014]|uniref:PRC-barrel domain-containing protein n=1 Tax=Gomphosphaeria aponina SAG 52.96 = DSM 107014 TaxID=1521640 RepID=A0A941GUF5_9CHRO|nr:PRC-barrel domain-containing protein [Gomphosphaeria aponina SAG 52.96 = DSM 107014]